MDHRRYHDDALVADSFSPSSSLSHSSGGYRVHGDGGDELKGDEAGILPERPQFRSMAMRPFSHQPVLVQQRLDRLNVKESHAVNISDHSSPQCLSDSPTKFQSSPALQCRWISPQAPSPSYYYYPDFHHAKIPLESGVELNEIATCLKLCFGQLSLQTVCQDYPMAAHCNTLSQPAGLCYLSVIILRDEEDEDVGPCWIVEVQRRMSGVDGYEFGCRARAIIQAVKQLLDNRKQQQQHAQVSLSALPLPIVDPFPCHNLPWQKQQEMVDKLNRFVESSKPKNMAGRPLQQHSAELLLTMASQLQSTFIHERHLALETLTLVTDCFKTVRSTCVLASRTLLLGVSSALVPTESANAIHQAVISLALREPKRGCSRDGDDSLQEQAHLALICVANALQVVDSSDVEQFARECSGEKGDVVSFFLGELEHEDSGIDLGRAYFCLVILKAMCEKVPRLRERVLLQYNVIELARTIGQRAPHGAVERVSERLLEVLRGRQ